MEKKELPHDQPLALQPLTATAPPMPAGEGVPYSPPQELYVVDYTTADASPPPYQAVVQTQQVMQGYSAPHEDHLEQPTGYQAQADPAPPYPTYAQQPQHSQSNIVVLNQPIASPIIPPPAPDQMPMVGLIFNIVVLIICLMLGNILTLSCIIPALVIASIGIASNDNKKRMKFGNVSMILFIVSFTSGVFTLLIPVIIVVILVD